MMAAFKLGMSLSAATSSKKVGRSPSPPKLTKDMAANACALKGRQNNDPNFVDILYHGLQHLKI
jgi:hypothetical protein